MSKKVMRTLGLALALGLAASQVTADITLLDSTSNRYGKGVSATTNWSTLHSNPAENTYQETMRVTSVCVSGKTFVVAMGMAGIWDTTNSAGAGAGAGAGIVQAFDTNADGNMVPIPCS